MGEFPNKDTQFKKGESGNPEGMKPGFKNFRTLIRQAILDRYFQKKGKE